MEFITKVDVYKKEGSDIKPLLFQDKGEQFKVANTATAFAEGCISAIFLLNTQYVWRTKKVQVINLICTLTNAADILAL